MKDLSEHTKEVMSALEKATANGKDLHVSIWRSSDKLGKLKNHFFGRKASLSEYLNKYKAATGTGNATHLGKILPKYFGWLVGRYDKQICRRQIGSVYASNDFCRYALSHGKSS